MAAVHIIGAGIAGLSCAVHLAGLGLSVIVYEAAPQAGGRCRSFHDAGLGCVIDNGNHLVLAANDGVMDYLSRVGSQDSMRAPDQAAFPFVDLRNGDRWTVRPNEGRVPWWVFSPGRRVPGTRARDYLSGVRLATAKPAATTADRIGPDNPLYTRFWEPLILAVMNTAPETAAARPMGTVLQETFGRGGRACRPLVARAGLSASFVDPALAALERAGAAVHLSYRIRSIGFDGDRARSLSAAGADIALGSDDWLVVAVPPAMAADLVPGLDVPQGSTPIVNAHFRLPSAVEAPLGAPFVGIIGGAAHWLFLRGDVASVTVSGAEGLVDWPSKEIAETLWRDVAHVLEVKPNPAPPSRIIKERRATFLQSPANQRLRPPPQTRWRNLLLAGDWTDTGLPATIEGAVRSGRTAASLVV